MCLLTFYVSKSCLGYSPFNVLVNVSQFSQVDLQKVQNISGVATQGSSMGTWVTEYMLNYSLDGVLWKTYSNHSGKEKVTIEDNDIH